MRQASFHIEDPPILGAGVQSSVATATQHSRSVHPCFLHEESSNHNPNKQHKVNRKSRPDWWPIVVTCHVIGVTWFARISSHLSTQLEKSRPAHLQIAFFENNVVAVEISGRRDQGPRAWHKSDYGTAVATLPQAGEHISVRYLTNRS